MTNKQFQELLSKYPDDMPVRLQTNGPLPFATQEIDFSEENILLTSETAYADDEALEEGWDSVDGKIELGDGLQYLLLNPTID